MVELEILKDCSSRLEVVHALFDIAIHNNGIVTRNGVALTPDEVAKDAFYYLNEVMISLDEQIEELEEEIGFFIRIDEKLLGGRS